MSFSQLDALYTHIWSSVKNTSPILDIVVCETLSWFLLPSNSHSKLEFAPTKWSEAVSCIMSYRCSVGFLGSSPKWFDRAQTTFAGFRTHYFADDREGMRGLELGSLCFLLREAYALVAVEPIPNGQTNVRILHAPLLDFFGRPFKDINISESELLITKHITNCLQTISYRQWWWKNQHKNRFLRNPCARV